MSEQFRSNPISRVLEDKVVDRAIINFSKEKSDEILKFYKYSDIIQKINAVDFTLKELTEIKILDGKSIDIIEVLLKNNLIGKIDDKSDETEYAFLDIRLAFDACPNMNLNDFIAKKAYQCTAINCNNIFYRDFDSKTYRCPKCNTEKGS